MLPSQERWEGGVVPLGKLQCTSYNRIPFMQSTENQDTQVIIPRVHISENLL